MPIHSNLLVHWTCKEPNTTPEQYIARLKNTIFRGLYLNKGREVIVGNRNTQINADISRICLTEIKLSKVEQHTLKYGKLGIGFSRDFVISNYGNPVTYVTNSDHSSLLVEHYAFLHQFLRTVENREMLARLEYLMGFVKNMSDVNNNDMVYYEEMEWRITHNDVLEQAGHIVAEDLDRGVYRLHFDAEQIKLIVFPNEETKSIALVDNELLPLIQQHHPILLTLENCKQF